MANHAEESGDPGCMACPGEMDALFTTISDGVAIYDAEGRLIRMNAGLRRLLSLDLHPGYATASLESRLSRLRLRDRQGQPMLREQWPHIRALRGEVLTGSEAVTSLVTALDGRDLLLSTSAAPVRDGEGRIVGAVCVTRDATERWRLAEELAARVRQIDAIFDAMPDGLGFFDAQGTVMRFNRAAGDLFATDRREALETLPDAYAVRTLDGAPFPVEDLPLTRALQGEPDRAAEMLVRQADGNEQIISVRAAAWLGPRETLEGVVVVAHDVTALRQAERDAAARASELEAIFEAMTDAVYVNDADGQLLHMNVAARAFTTEGNVPDALRYGGSERTGGTPRGEQGQPLTSEQWPLTRVLGGEVLTGERAVDMLVRTVDGRDRQVSVTGAPVRDDAGHVIRAVTVVRDVTERRRLEQRTHQALDALLRMARTLVLPTGDAGDAAREGRYEIGQRLVALTRDMLGCDRVALAAFDLEAGVQHPVAVAGLSAEHERAWWATVEGAPIANPQVVIDPAILARFFSGEVVVFDMTQPPYSDQPNPFGIRAVLIAPLRVDTGIIGALSLDYGGVDHAYTPEEIALSGAVAQLAALTLERERLRREREEARAAELALRDTNQRMDEFLAIASHELKSPLTGMLGSVQLAQRRLRRLLAQGDRSAGELEAAIAPIAELLRRSEQQIGRQASLIDDLLDVSRIQSGHLELRLERCDLAALARECVEEQRALWPARTLTLETPPSPLVVRADPRRIRQVIANFVSNALKYSASDRPVDVRLQLDGEFARAHVRDYGPGLAPEQQPRIWERYRRVPGVVVQDGSQAGGGGLGLGLFISKTIIEQHGGQVDVESTLGEGSTFWCALPLAPPSGE